MFKTAAVVLAIVALAWGQTTPVNRCIFHGGSEPINTYIEGCPSPPCQLPQMQDVVLNIIFQAPRTIRSMRTVATAYLLGPLGIPYDLGDEAVTCNFLTNTYCPVLQDEVVTYTLRMFIESFFPVGTSVTIEFRINDEATNSPIMCLRVPVAITAALPGSAAARASRTPTSNSTVPITVRLNNA